MTGTLTFLREFRPPRTVADRSLDTDSERSVEAAYQKGLADGIAQARAEIDNENAAAIDRMTAAMRETHALRTSILAAVSAEAGTAVAAVVRAMCPQLAASGLAETAKALMVDELQKVPRPLTIKVATESVKGLTEMLAGHLDTDTIIEADESLSPSHVRFEWFQGSASVDVDELATRIAKLADSIGAETPETSKVRHDGND